MAFVNRDAQTADNAADQLRRQMAMVRRDLGADIRGVADHARELTDWRSYVQKAPWAGLAIAAAAGFMAVPRRLNIDTVDAATLARLAKQNRLVVESKPKAAAKTGSATVMFRLLSGILLRSAFGFATQKAAEFMSPENPARSPRAPQKTGTTE